MQQHGAQLRGGKLFRQRARQQDHRAEQAAHGGGHGVVRQSQPHRLNGKLGETPASSSRPASLADAAARRASGRPGASAASIHASKPRLTVAMPSKRPGRQASVSAAAARGTGTAGVVAATVRRRLCIVGDDDGG